MFFFFLHCTVYVSVAAHSADRCTHRRLRAARRAPRARGLSRAPARAAMLAYRLHCAATEPLAAHRQQDQQMTAQHTIGSARIAPTTRVPLSSRPYPSGPCPPPIRQLPAHRPPRRATPHPGGTRSPLHSSRMLDKRALRAQRRPACPLIRAPRPAGPRCRARRRRRRRRPRRGTSSSSIPGCRSRCKPTWRRPPRRRRPGATRA